jgi:hypothetical protein
MFRSITTYTCGALVIEVRPGESLSAAWTAITGTTPPPPAAGAQVHANRHCERRRPRSRGRRGWNRREAAPRPNP